MVGKVAIISFAVSFAAVLPGCLPSQAQEVIPPLEGGPGSGASNQDQSAAGSLRAEQARLARRAEELKAMEARLDARAAELAAEEKRLAQLRAEQQSDQATRLAELIRQGHDVGDEEEPRFPEDSTDPSPNDFPAIRDGETADDLSDDLPDVQPESGTRRSLYARVDYDAAELACARAAEDEALERNFYSARYDRAPRFYRGYGLELRGPMRLADRRGYRLVDTVCEVAADGEVQHFVFLR